MRRFLYIFIYTVMLVVVTGCVADDEPTEWSLAVGERIPEFSVTLDDGSVLTSDDLAGKTAVIIFFNTSCSDCRRELPRLQKAYEERGDDVEFVCIAREESADDIGRFWRENGITMPYSPQSDRHIYNMFASVGIPRVYVISPEGIIIRVEVQVMSYLII